MFVVLAVIGVLLIVVSLLFDDVIDGVLPESDLISGPALGAFLGALGIVGWVLQTGFDAPGAVAAAGGVAGGLGLGYVTARSARALLRSPTDATPRSADLVGRQARVITGVPPGGTGEVMVSLGGQPVKLTATTSGTASNAGAELPVGTNVVIVAVASSTKVVVEASDEFWN